MTTIQYNEISQEAQDFKEKSGYKYQIVLATKNKTWTVVTNNEKVFDEIRKEVEKVGKWSDSYDKVEAYGGVMNFIKHLMKCDQTYVFSWNKHKLDNSDQAKKLIE